ncbi:MAG: hypothetical protein H6606_06520 [Flavobacteriales bacterium]|nr:hypothetical protein [Flavobacteriales bacterium]
MRTTLLVAILAGVAVFFLSRAGWNRSTADVESVEQTESENSPEEGGHSGHDHSDLDERARLAGEKVANAQNSEDIMSGVMELREILKLDSNHVASIELLAELSVTSGQLDKAIERYEKLLSLQPENQEYRERLKAICEMAGRSDCS